MDSGDRRLAEPAVGDPPAFALLFTDIEGSTRHWETSPDAMAAAQARHDQILRRAIDANQGELLQTVGDSHRAMFPTVELAAQAAIAAQIAFTETDWSLAGGLRVRMAIHSLTAGANRDDVFRSPETVRLESLLAIAHGGQILLSAAASDEMRGHRSPDLRTIELGGWVLPGINQPERIAQVGHDRLRSDFPRFEALRVNGLANRYRADRFIGRGQEMAELQRLLEQPDVRLITLTGPGGIGKTRLAREFAMRLNAADAYPVSFVDLVGLSEPALVLATIASALQIQEFGHQSVMDALVDSMRDRETLLVLDNFEHVLDAAEEVGILLTRLPKLRALTTSRIPLRIRGEWQLPIPPLPTPSDVVSIWDEATRFESVVLFADRARSADPSVEIETRQASAVAAICRKLEGVPLAIELAAPLVRVLSLDELNERLDDRLSLDAGAYASTDDRHRAIRTSIAWSFELLDPQTQLVLSRLGVLQNGFTFETLEGLLGDQFDVLAHLERLVEQNLVHQGGFQRDAERFFLLESVRQFALEQLESAGALAEMQRRHARYFSSLLLDRFPDQRDYDADAVRQLRPVIDDLYQAIYWTLEQDPARALGLAAGAWRLWFVVGQLQAAEQWLSEVLGATESLQSVERVRAIYGQALTTSANATVAESIALCDRSLALAERLGDLRGVGDACNYKAGIIAEQLGDFEQAAELIDTALLAYSTIDDRHGWAESLLNRASLRYELGQLEASLDDGEQLLAYCRSEGKDVLASNSIHGVAGIALFAGHPERTRTLLIEGFELSRKLGYDLYLGANISVLGMLMNSLGKFEDGLRMTEFGATFAETAPGAATVSDPFQHNERERSVQMTSLAPDVAQRAIAAGRRLTPVDAVEQSLELLRGLTISS